MEIDEALEIARCQADHLAAKYGLWCQFDRASMRQDLIQGAITEWLSARRLGMNLRQAIWRGIHEEIRLMVYGSRGKRDVRMSNVGPPLDRADDYLSVEGQADFLRAVERIPAGSAAWAYYLEDKSTIEVGRERGRSHVAISQSISRWRQQFSEVA